MAILPVLQRILHWCLVNPCLWCCFPVDKADAQLCSHCRNALPRLHTPSAVPMLTLPAILFGLNKPIFNELYSISWYQPPWSHWLLRWKYQLDHSVGQALLQEFSSSAGRWAITADAVCFVPLSRARRKQRGFNQAQALAAVLAAAYRIPLLDLFDGGQSSPHQLGASAAERRAQLRRQFSWRLPLHRFAPLPRRIILVDDVITTGSTLHQLCRLLRKAGVQHIIVCTLAITAAPGINLQLYSSPSSLPLSELNTLPK